ncbi:DMT family transporter [Vibrio chagasii]|uniref:DMT family transporter n=1 Tax=Vibrio chagasii TaxID=170679 RepID=UPI001EFC505B|nr:EamA family transporter [Vibrio chagasii]MCG9560138.1 DMT family transporter [Vibrio chagasii]
MMKSVTKGWMAAIGVGLLWGSEGALATLPLQTIDARLLVWLRYMMAFFVLSLVLIFSAMLHKKTQSKPKLAFSWANRSELFKLLVCGVVGQGLFSFLSFLSLDYISLSENGVIQGLVPIAILAIGQLFYGARFTRMQIVSSGIALVGVTMLVLAPPFTSQDRGVNIGHLICLLSVLSFASVTHLRAQLAEKYGATCTMHYQFGFAAVGFFIYLLVSGIDVPSLLLVIRPSWSLLCIIVLGGFVSGLGYIAYIYGIERVGVEGSSMALNLIPMSAFFIAVLVFGEPITPFRALAVGLIIVAMTLFAASDKSREMTSKTVLTN